MRSAVGLVGCVLGTLAACGDGPGVGDPKPAAARGGDPAVASAAPAAVDAGTPRAPDEPAARTRASERVHLRWLCVADDGQAPPETPEFAVFGPRGDVFGSGRGTEWIGSVPTGEPIHLVVFVPGFAARVVPRDRTSTDVERLTLTRTTGRATVSAVGRPDLVLRGNLRFEYWAGLPTPRRVLATTRPFVGRSGPFTVALDPRMRVRLYVERHDQGFLWPTFSDLREGELALHPEEPTVAPVVVETADGERSSDGLLGLHVWPSASSLAAWPPAKAESYGWWNMGGAATVRRVDGRLVVELFDAAYDGVASADGSGVPVHVPRSAREVRVRRAVPAALTWDPGVGADAGGPASGVVVPGAHGLDRLRTLLGGAVAPEVAYDLRTLRNQRGGELPLADAYTIRGDDGVVYAAHARDGQLVPERPEPGSIVVSVARGESAQIVSLTRRDPGAGRVRSGRWQPDAGTEVAPGVPRVFRGLPPGRYAVSYALAARGASEVGAGTSDLQSIELDITAPPHRAEVTLPAVSAPPR
ncbi:MAG: hypothetical protein JNM10_06300 [Planctomycetia bacterium]|nr:hypothetical protein [Planctomycetia bacterium]